MSSLTPVVAATFNNDTATLLAVQNKNSDMQTRFAKVAQQLSDNEEKIVAEMKMFRGRPWILMVISGPIWK